MPLLPSIILGASLALACAGAHAEDVTEAGVCQLVSQPAEYNHKLVRVMDEFSHGFEDFTLSEKGCRDRVWLEYGGKQKSGTMYCCGVTADKKRRAALTIDGLATTINEDDNFHLFDTAISGKKGNVHGQLALEGRFFAGQDSNDPGKIQLGAGFGHFGMFNLLVIQKVLRFETATSP